MAYAAALTRRCFLHPDWAQVCDRTALILDIFSQRAQTREGKLQVCGCGTASACPAVAVLAPKSTACALILHWVLHKGSVPLACVSGSFALCWHVVNERRSTSCTQPSCIWPLCLAAWPCASLWAMIKGVCTCFKLGCRQQAVCAVGYSCYANRFNAGAECSARAKRWT